MRSLFKITIAGNNLGSPLPRTLQRELPAVAALAVRGSEARTSVQIIIGPPKSSLETSLHPKGTNLATLQVEVLIWRSGMMVLIGDRAAALVSLVSRPQSGGGIGTRRLAPNWYSLPYNTISHSNSAKW